MLNTYWAWLPFFSDAFGIYLIMQYMLAIPMDLDEAARIDGANMWQIFAKIIMPQTLPALVVLITFNFVPYLLFPYPVVIFHVVLDSRFIL